MSLYDTVAEHCEARDFDALAELAPKIGYVIDAASLDALKATLVRKGLAPACRRLTIAHAVRVMAEAAAHKDGVAILEVARSDSQKYPLGKEIAVAYGDDTHVHIGVRYAEKMSMQASALWSDLKPWYKTLKRNQAKLAKWAGNSESGAIAFARTSAASSAAGDKGGSGDKGDALLQAILADPANVAARMSYADWLAKREDPQSQLIRLGQRLSEVPEHEINTESWHMDVRMEIMGIERDHKDRIAGLIAQHAKTFRLDRGFVSEIEIKAAAFAKHGAEMLDAHPIEKVSLVPLNTAALNRLAKAEVTKRVRGLRFATPHGTRAPAVDFERFCGEAQLDALTTLDLSSLRGLEGDLTKAFAALNAPQLAHVDLYALGEFHEPIAKGLAKNKRLQLKSCHISNNSFKDAAPAMAPLCKGPAFSQLQVLELSMVDPALSKALKDLGKRGHAALRDLRLGPSELSLENLDDLLSPGLAIESLTCSGFTDPEACAKRLLALPKKHSLKQIVIFDDDPVFAKVRARFAG